MNPFRQPLFVLILLCLGHPAVAYDEEPDLDLNELSDGLLHSDLSLPCPSEMFLAIGRKSNPRWRTHYRPPLSRVTPNRSVGALYLGVKLTDIHLAVQAHDVQQVSNLCQDLKRIAQNLAIGSNLKEKITAIQSEAEQLRWDESRLEIDRTNHTVTQLFRAQNDADLAALIDLGHWIRAMEISCGAVKAEDHKDLQIVIGGQGTLTQLQQRVAQLPDDLKKQKSVAKIEDHLAQISHHWQIDKTPTIETVAVTQSLLREIFEEWIDQP